MTRVEEIIAAGRELIREEHYAGILVSRGHHEVCVRFAQWYRSNSIAVQDGWLQLLPELAELSIAQTPADHPARFVAIGMLQSTIKGWLSAFAGKPDWVADARVYLHFPRTGETFQQAAPGMVLPSPAEQLREGRN